MEIRRFSKDVRTLKEAAASRARLETSEGKAKPGHEEEYNEAVERHLAAKRHLVGHAKNQQDIDDISVINASAFTAALREE